MSGAPRGDMTRAAVAIERALLGGLLLYPSEIHEAADLTPEDFIRPQHGKLYTLMQSWDAASPEWGLATLGEMLQRGSLPERDYGTASELLTMPNEGTIPEHVRGNAERVRAYAVRRKARALCCEGEASIATTDAPHALIEDLADRLGELVHGKRETSRPTTLREEMPRFLERMQTRATADGAVLGITTGLDELDVMTHGLHGGKLYLVAARPGMGKSVVMRMLALAAAAHGHPVLILSLEMPKDEVTDALVAAHGIIDYTGIQTGKLNESQERRLSETAEALADLPIIIDDRAGLTLPQVLSTIRRFARRGGKLVIVDYLQLIRPNHRMDAREAVSAASGALKIAAKMHGIPIVAGAQLNRDVESRTGHRPILSDLKESGSLEQDADGVMMLYRPEECEPDGERGLIEIIMRKLRGGKKGTIRARWRGEYQRVESFEPGMAPPPAATPTTAPKKKTKAPKGSGYSVDPDDPGPMY